MVEKKRAKEQPNKTKRDPNPTQLFNKVNSVRINKSIIKRDQRNGKDLQRESKDFGINE